MNIYLSQNKITSILEDAFKTAGFEDELITPDNLMRLIGEELGSTGYEIALEDKMISSPYIYFIFSITPEGKDKTCFMYEGSYSSSTDSSGFTQEWIEWDETTDFEIVEHKEVTVMRWCLVEQV